MSYTKHFSE